MFEASGLGSHFPILSIRPRPRINSSRAMLRPEHYLRTPPAIAPAPLTALPTLSRLRPGTVRLPCDCEAPLPRGKPSSTVRASAPPMREAAASRMPSLPHREVARALADEAEVRLGAQLLPSAVPADVAEFRNGAGTAVGTLDVRRGAPASSVVSLPLPSARYSDIEFFSHNQVVAPTRLVCHAKLNPIRRVILFDCCRGIFHEVGPHTFFL